MCTRSEQDVDLIGAGFDAVTDSLRWWTLPTEPWYLSRAVLINRSGGLRVSFASSHDTETFAATYDDEHLRMTRLALTALMSSSFFMMEGTLSLQQAQPTVFLADHLGSTSHVENDFSDEGKKIRELVSLLIGVKKKYPIFRANPDISVTTSGGGDVQIKLTREFEEALLAMNLGLNQRAVEISPEFAFGHTFGVNLGHYSVVDLGLSIDRFTLAPNGIAVFHRDRPTRAPSPW